MLPGPVLQGLFWRAVHLLPRRPHGRVLRWQAPRDPWLQWAQSDTIATNAIATIANAIANTSANAAAAEHARLHDNASGHLREPRHPVLLGAELRERGALLQGGRQDKRVQVLRCRLVRGLPVKGGRRLRSEATFARRTRAAYSQIVPLLQQPAMHCASRRLELRIGVARHRAAVV